ncbi:MAG: hypothetical protein ACJ8G1_08570 [Vitreoscilla sp.]
MRTWPALLLAPALALADQVVAFAVVGWACDQGRPWLVHLIHVAFCLATVATLPSAWRGWRTRPAGTALQDERIAFLAGLAVASATLSVLVIAAMWLPTWYIGPCVR